MDFLVGFSYLTVGLLLLIGLMTAWFVGPGYNSHSANHSPTILTSTGIFGTFLGVALGLLSFDTRDIQASVPELIEGLKTAFWTSIAGLLGALFVKFRHLVAVLKQRQVDERYRSASITDLANLLGDIRDSLSDVHGNGLRSAFAAMQRDQHEQGANLLLSLETYQVRMAEANSQALIVAIETVMKDFNTQINTQYGENFKELNQAVGRMLTWQESYKSELEELLESQRFNGHLLDKASHAYEKMVAHSEVFDRVSNSLGDMLSALQSQSEGLDNYLSQLAKVANQAASGLPELENRMTALTTTLAQSVTDSQDRVSHLLLDSAQSLKQTSQDINQALSSTLIDAQCALHERVEQMVALTEKQLMRLDDAMEDELTKALKTFGYQMASLSEKFVSDYLPLTDKLRQLVRLAEKTGFENEDSPEQRSRVAS